MQRKSALVGEAVQGLSVGITCSRSVVLALIEKRSRLLTAECVEMETHAVDSENRTRAPALNELRLARRELLQLADVRIHAFEQAAFREMLRHGVSHYAAEIIAVERLGQRLHGQHVVVLVQDQAR